MKETVAYCDLDEKDARRPGVAVLSIEINSTIHVMDVCQPHLTLLNRLPTSAARARRGRPAKSAPAKRAAVKAPAAKAVAKAGPAKAAPAKKAAAKSAAVKSAAKATAPAKKAPGRNAAAKAPARRAASKASAAVAGRTPGSRRDQQQRVAAARDWARAQGRTIAGKGRLPAGLLEEFDAASR